MGRKYYRLNKVDKTINFDWRDGRPHRSVGRDSFATRWTGWVAPRYSERYTFHVIGDDDDAS